MLEEAKRRAAATSARIYLERRGADRREARRAARRRGREPAPRIDDRVLERFRAAVDDLPGTARGDPSRTDTNARTRGAPAARGGGSCPPRLSRGAPGPRTPV